MKCPKVTIMGSLALSLALAVPASAGDLSAAERAALGAPPAPELLALRAGDETGVAPFAAVERTALARAQAAAPDLDALRAGDIDNDDLVIIAIIVAVVALAVAL
jgi:hypothetical protein